MKNCPSAVDLQRFLTFLCLCLGSFTLNGETIRIGLAMPEDMPEVDYLNGMYRLFKQAVETRSEHRIRVQLYYGGVLGRPDERLNYMRRNIIQMSDASDGNYATIFRDIQVFSMPYLFSDRDSAHRILDGPVGQSVAESLREKTGIRVLGWWESAGFKHYSSNRPIRHPDDLDGQKMRVMSAAFSVPVIAMGGAATPVPMPELYISLKTGVVDGQDNAVSVFNMLKLYEVQNYLTLDAHIYSFGPLGINDEFFNSLDRQLQDVILEAGREAVAWNRKRALEQENEALAVVRARDVELIIPSPEVRREFMHLTRPAAVRWMKRNLDTPELVDRVLAAVKSDEGN